MLTRRRFLAGAAGLVGSVSFSGMLPVYRAAVNSGAPKGRRVLVVVELYGGNDGLNTVIPYQNSVYYAKRPTLAVPAHAALPLNAELALHPSLKPVLSWFHQGRLAVVQGVGYPNPNLSHFRSMDIWWTADPVGEQATGWLGRYMDSTWEKNPLRAVNIGSAVPKTLASRKSSVASVMSLQGAQYAIPAYEGGRAGWMSAYRALNAPRPNDPPALALVKAAGREAVSVSDTLGSVHVATTAAYPQNSLGAQLALVSTLIRANLPVEIFTVSLGGFDDHASESGQEARTLGDWALAMDAFFRDLSAQGNAGRVLALTYSEFGRRVMENASGGTDHGTASSVVVMGGAVKGGIYGETPSLTGLDTAGNLKFTVDFRQIYSTLLENWLGNDPAPAVGKRWPAMGFV